MNPITLSTINKVFPSLIASEITDIQPMAVRGPITRQRHWKITGAGHKWILERWWTYNIFTIREPKETPAYHRETTEFPSRSAAEEKMLLEKLEQ